MRLATLERLLTLALVRAPAPSLAASACPETVAFDPAPNESAPQSVAVGGVAACYTHALTSPPTGSVNVESGAFTVALEYQSVLCQGSGCLTACPKCVDDPVANDGVRAGTCTSGTRTGLACDGHGRPAPGYEELGTSSFDCPPFPGTILSISNHGPLTTPGDRLRTTHQ